MNQLDELFASHGGVTLQEWARILQEASNGPNSGSEVSRGKDPMDQSQIAKDEGSAAPPPGGFAEPGMDPAMMDPALAGGGGGDPIAVGKKDVETDARQAVTEPKVELGGGKDGVDLEPVIEPEPQGGGEEGGNPEDESQKGKAGKKGTLDKKK